jgi:hypothetical protein
MPDPTGLYPVVREHLETLSDATGIWQHARGTQPDRRHGYCTDDVARALSVDVAHAHELGWDAIAPSAWRSLSFLVAAFQPGSGRFRNLRAADGRWIDGPDSEDAHARAMLALAETLAGEGDGRVRGVANTLFLRALPAAVELQALRPRATVVLALLVAARAGLRDELRLAQRRVGRALVSAMQAPRHAPDWPWPERSLTYENALPVRALIELGAHDRDGAVLRRGLELLDWLACSQTRDGHFSPIGNRGWWPRGGRRARWGQQPIEATTLILAAQAALEATGEKRFGELMELGYGWFLGANDLGMAVAVPGDGGCHDGLEADGVNANQGAESTLMWLLALEALRRLRRRILTRRPSALRLSPVAESRAAPSPRSRRPRSARPTSPPRAPSRP